MSKHLMLTGIPAVGKTTLIQRVLEQLASQTNLNAIATGFYTEEVRGSSGRLGFDVVSLTGRRGSLARKEIPHRRVAGPKLGSYFVDVASFESIALTEMVRSPQTKLIVVDEIGKMEFYSEAFQEAVKNVLDSTCVVFGVIPKLKLTQTYSGVSGCLVEILQVQEIQRRSDVNVVEVTKKNRDGLVEALTAELKNLLEMEHPLKM